MSIGGQYHSISHSGMRIFDQRIATTVGGVVIDLASAPIAPGEYRLHVETGVGGIEIYLPRYATFTVEGGPAIGGYDVHEGLGIWNGLVVKMQRLLRLSNRIPAKAAEPIDPNQPVAIHLVIDSGVGGIDIYRV
jgi:hypothetical protein